MPVMPTLLTGIRIAKLLVLLEASRSPLALLLLLIRPLLPLLLLLLVHALASRMSLPIAIEA